MQNPTRKTGVVSTPPPDVKVSEALVMILLPDCLVAALHTVRPGLPLRWQLGASKPPFLQHPL